ncbi:hypothetical protein CVU76_00045 [Candidatus Dojkabacteria bacterium HGW-Dojkabacteria-1]|uniref:HTH deoR-type domain-containing protein n=1 Tax=Candidatus Dojkabacteria bacterium HGW-Dojkabacteria-1 TaxID=2013761 RepID=A0A2N2F2R0_9BACT|nr:MAG: hypothetical protein CVU76_00045 [Candidatus Dojkabacteria bacterium HGW-Dojkabacteria-1]
MFKKIIGFLIPIIGLVLILEYLNTNKEKNEKIVSKEITPRIKKKQLVRVNLNQRQQNILKLFNKRETLLPTDIYSVAPNLSTRTLRRDMDKLVEAGLVLKDGSTKDTRYRLKK